MVERSYISRLQDVCGFPLFFLSAFYLRDGVFTRISLRGFNVFNKSAFGGDDKVIRYLLGVLLWVNK